MPATRAIPAGPAGPAVPAERPPPPWRGGWRVPRGAPWPLPALAAWGAAWGLHALLRGAGVAPAWAFMLAAAAAGAAALGCERRWRRLIVAGGFPLSALAAGAAAGLPAVAWLLPLALLLLAYPRRAWRDAPLFPTPAGALDGLAPLLALPAAPRLLDAGCGLGHGLAALHRAWPAARLAGIEFSRPLQWAAAWRCRRFAQVRGGDMWRPGAWAGHDLVYLFQRPESMARAWAKAQAELAPGAWLVSLEFAVAGVAPQACARAPDGRPVWAWRVGAPAAQSGTPAADMPPMPPAKRRRRPTRA